MLKNTVIFFSIGLLFSLSVFIVRGSLLRFTDVSQNAAVFFVDNIKPADLLVKYANAGKEKSAGKIRIFLMPGHEPNFGGTEYRDIKERDINVILAQELQAFLEKDPKFEVVVGRDGEKWNPDLADYFAHHMSDIRKWKESQANTMRDLIKEGEFDLLGDPVPHQNVPSDVALRLYGINKWVGENDFDMAVHLHINDYGGRKSNRPGKFTGFTIYIPEDQYSNSQAAHEIATSVKERLAQVIAVSDSERENEGVVEDQNLVAIGRYNTADVPSMLIEYGYIYEPQFQDKEVTPAILKEYAHQTYLGIRDFFITHDGATKTRDSALLPHTWDRELGVSDDYSLDVLALQAALWESGFYPPANKDMRSCPLTGVFGSCTKTALDEFQKKNLIDGESGRLGNTTRAILDSKFSK